MLNSSAMAAWYLQQRPGEMRMFHCSVAFTARSLFTASCVGRFPGTARTGCSNLASELLPAAALGTAEACREFMEQAAPSSPLVRGTRLFSGRCARAELSVSRRSLPSSAASTRARASLPSLALTRARVGMCFAMSGSVHDDASMWTCAMEGRPCGSRHSIPWHISLHSLCRGMPSLHWSGCVTPLLAISMMTFLLMPCIGFRQAIIR
mmetsp:Transcript_69371/g.206615  ORF Transcript_69371/g.206615 Transcript_69371/m.206615 type:complete len:208 (+) Transcript_69371:704-1327(+)